MGLDMYLCRHKLNDNDGNPLDIPSILENGSEDVEDLIYWRKANQIREWFALNLEGFEDNGSTIVTEENLDDLIDTIDEVLDNHNLAKELLPTSDGFFFGSQEYDGYYWEALKRTSKELKDVRKHTDFDTEFLFYHEWY